MTPEEIKEKPSLDAAERLAKQCSYAWDAKGTKENPINWGDAGAFFLEGWLHGLRQNAGTRTQALKIVINNAQEIKNEIGGVVGYELFLNEDDTRELWNLLQE